MKQVNYVVSPRPGGNVRGALGEDASVLLLPPGGGNRISLNLATTEILSYERVGDDLYITLLDGTFVVLSGYFDGDSFGASRLFVSVEGVINEVNVIDDSCSKLEVHYGPTQAWAEWSPLNELIFIDDHVINQVVLLSDGDLLGPVLGGIGIGGLLLLGRGGADGSVQHGPPAVDDPDAVIRIGGDAPRAVLVSGTAEPGSDVSVTIDGITMSTIANGERGWSLAFEGANFPGDGSYQDIQVAVTEPEGAVTTLDGPTYLIDTKQPLITVDDGSVSTGDVFNAISHASGVTLSGQAEVGSTVTMSLDTFTRTAVVGADGLWRFTFNSIALPAGEYTRDFTVTATDAFGNRTSLSDAVRIDTVANPLTIDAVTGDYLLNSTEDTEGFTITGVSAPGALVNVSFAGITQDVMAGDNGVWAMAIKPDALPDGEYDATVTATTVDAAGNATSATATVHVDTNTFVSLLNTPLTADNLINATELAAGGMLVGNGEPGSTIVVTFSEVAQARFAAVENSMTQTAVVAADGSWTIKLSSPALFKAAQNVAISPQAGVELPYGTYDARVTVVATDAAGNTASVLHDFCVDTETSVSMRMANVGGDGTVNAAELGDGILVVGQGEPGASVVLNVEGAQFTTVVDASGDWSVTLPVEIVPEGSLFLKATATDIAGNVATAFEAIDVDTQTAVSVETDRVEGDGTVNANERADGVTLTGQAEAGAAVQVTLGAITKSVTTTAAGYWGADFDAAEIPSGERVLTVTAVATDAAGNTASASDTLAIDTLVSNFSSTAVPGGSDKIVNAAEAAQGVTFGGTTEPGSTVTVNLAGVQKSANVSGEGNWSVTFASGQLPSGELDATMTAVATDAAGNTKTITQLVQFDTDVGHLTIDTTPVEGNDVVNFVEASDGVVLTGTSDPGQAVQVTMAGVTVDVMTNAAGTWSALFTAANVAPGTYVAQISATISDSAGNTLTRTDSVQVDTAVTNFALSSVPIQGDGIVNALEAPSGVRLSGTVEQGATVEILFGSVKYVAGVDAAGNWLVDLPGNTIPRGETVEALVVNTTDLAGNTAQLSSVLTIDTEVNRLTLDGGLMIADGLLNAREAAQGLTLTGQVEAGSTIVVTLGGVAHVAEVNQTGDWIVDIPEEAIPRGTLTADIGIEATDMAGNSRSMTQSVSIDTDKPGVPVWIDYSRNNSGLTSITLDTVSHVVDIGHLSNGTGGVSVVDLDVIAKYDIPDVGTNHRFGSSVADGSHLVVSYSDTSGNMSGALLVTDDLATSELRFTNQMAQALGAFDVELIDLSFAEDTSLTLTEYQIMALSSSSDTVAVLGGSDDTVTIIGGNHAGTTQVDGQGFNLYTLGDASILIDENITNVNTGVV